MKKIFIFIVVCLMSISVWGYDVEVDGIYYKLNETDKTAEVTFENTSFSSYKAKVTIPESFIYRKKTYTVISIGEHAFDNSTSLTSVIIPNSLTSIGEGAFYYCYGLTSITIPNSVTSIGGYAFCGCSGLTTVKISDSLTSIDNGIFYKCSSLFAVNIPNSVTSIGKCAFYECSNLASVSIGNSVTSIGGAAFADCSSLTKVIVSDLNSWLRISFDFTGGISNPLYFAHHLFVNDEEVKDLVIPNTVTSIGAGAFWGCSGLTSVTIPNTVNDIGSSAFCGCSGMTSVTIGNSVTSIGEYAFGNCSKNIETVTCYAEKVPSMGSDVFKDSYVSYATLKVPDASLDLYKAADQWKKFGTIQGLNGTEPETKKCAKPTISYADKKLIYSTETEGAEVIGEITSADVKKTYDTEVSLTATYNISAYATKSGYDDSETATATLVWATATLTPDVPTEAKEISVDALPLLISQEEGMVTISGLNDGDDITAYGVDGSEVAQCRAVGGAALMNLSALQGKVAVLRVDGRNCKVMIK